jgi:excisionase family DNA binding protein
LSWWSDTRLGSARPLTLSMGSPTMPYRVDDLPDLATPKQVREALQLSDRQLRKLIHERRIGHVAIGARFLIPRESIRKFIAENTVPPSCPDETKAHVSASSTSEPYSTSFGQSAVAAASAARAQQIASKLKARSPNSCNRIPGDSARVIRLQSS